MDIDLDFTSAHDYHELHNIEKIIFKVITREKFDAFAKKHNFIIADDKIKFFQRELSHTIQLLKYRDNDDFNYDFVRLTAAMLDIDLDLLVSLIMIKDLSLDFAEIPGIEVVIRVATNILNLYGNTKKLDCIIVSNSCTEID